MTCGSYGLTGRASWSLSPRSQHCSLTGGPQKGRCVRRHENNLGASPRQLPRARLQPRCSALAELKTVTVLLCIGLWLREHWGWFDLCEPLELSPCQHEAVPPSYHSCVHWSGAFNAPQEPFLRVDNLAIGCRSRSLGPVAAADVPPPRGAAISGFALK